MMQDENDTELTAEERMMLAALPRELEPSDLLQERVVRALRKNGHFGASRRERNRPLHVALRIAAAAALFAGGVATGRFLMTPSNTQTVSAPAPAAIRGVDNSRPSTGPTPVRRTETVVAEREMWL